MYQKNESILFMFLNWLLFIYLPKAELLIRPPTQDSTRQHTNETREIFEHDANFQSQGRNLPTERGSTVPPEYGGVLPSEPGGIRRYLARWRGDGADT